MSGLVRRLGAGLLALATAGNAQAQPAGAARPTGELTTVVVPPRLMSEAAVAYPPGAHGDAVVVLTLTVNMRDD